MGSGCTNSNSTTNSWFQKATPDTSVTYTGPAIPALGICTGDTLSEVEAVILGQIINFSTGVGIQIPNIDLTACNLFVNNIQCCDGDGTTPKALDDLMVIIFQALCTLYGDVATLTTELTALIDGPYNVGCLTLGANPTLSQIIQELILEYCALYSQVQILQTTVATLTSGLPTTIGNFLNAALSSCQSSGLTKSGTGASFTASFQGFVPIGAILPYAGMTSGLFDSTGLGLTGTDACGWALANGNNETWDMRGLAPMGAVNGMGGGSLPTNVTAPGAAYSLGDLAGEVQHTLISAEVPPTAISGTTVPTSGGTLTPPIWEAGRRPEQGNNSLSDQAQPPSPPVPFGISIPALTVTGNVSGGGGAHENRQPSRALYFIQRIS